MFWDHAAKELRDAASKFINLNQYLDFLTKKWTSNGMSIQAQATCHDDLSIVGSSAEPKSLFLQEVFIFFSSWLSNGRSVGAPASAWPANESEEC